MRLLLNENLPGSFARRLREMGHDVVAAKEAMRGADDLSVLARARAEARLLLTQDDFETGVRYGGTLALSMPAFGTGASSSGAEA